MGTFTILPWFLLQLKKFNQTGGAAKSDTAKVAMAAVNAIAYLIPGIAVFILAPAAVFCVLEEDWSYLDSFYFAFITLTTIGFGDFVAGLLFTIKPAFST